jgi:hypothetical protein
VKVIDPRTVTDSHPRASVLRKLDKVFGEVRGTYGSHSGGVSLLASLQTLALSVLSMDYKRYNDELLVLDTAIVQFASMCPDDESVIQSLKDIRDLLSSKPL